MEPKQRIGPPHQPPAHGNSNIVTNLTDDLATLRIDQSSRAGTTRRGVWVGLLILALVLGGAGWYWSQRVEAAEVKTASVAAQTGGASAPGAVLNASGYVTARRRATVSSKVTGKVLEVFVEEGKPVRAGQVLARLDDAQVTAALAVAEAQLEAARRGAAEDEARLREAELTLTRREQLVQQQVIGKAELDAARAEVESLKALADVVAPLSGEILAVNAALERRPDIVNDDPYGEGWVVRVRLADPAEQASLLDAEAYTRLVAEQ